MRDITLCHPRLQVLAAQLVQKCAEQGITIKIGETLRTVAEQNALYAQGRTTSGSIVTNAKGSSYSSMHQWGIAFDFYLAMDIDGDGKTSDDAFNNKTKMFNKVGAIGESLGLEWGGHWTSIVDLPHFQLPDWGSTATRLKNVYGTPETFMKTWKTSTSTSSTTEKGSGYMFNPLTVKNGSKGNSVLLCQEILKAKGYYSGELDGISGSRTVAAINAYQVRRRNQGVELGTNGANDGACGAKMWKDLIAI